MIDCLNGCGPSSQTMYEGVEIDICSICGGVWLDTGELTTIIETRERSWPESVIKKVLAASGGSDISAEERSRELSCPKCNKILPPINYQGNSGIIVNTCENGHGLWLDAGELPKIQIFMEQWGRVLRDDKPETEPASESHPGKGKTGLEAISNFLARLVRTSD